MRLIITGSFDCGFSFGIDDTIFDLVKNEEKIKLLNYQIIKNPKLLDLDINLGTGIKIISIPDEILNLWKIEAISIAKNDFEDDLLAQTIENSNLKLLTIDIFSLGIGYLRLDIDNIMIEKPEHIEFFYQCFEYAGYEKVSEPLKNIIIEVISIFQDNSEIQQISKRFEFEKVNPYDLFPGFYCIFIPKKTDNRDEILRVLQEYERQYKFKILDLDQGIIHFGYATAIIEPRFDNYDKILALFLIGDVFATICNAFEKLFSIYLISSVKNSFICSKSNFNPININKLRTLSLTINQLTLYNSITNNISDLYFFEAFEFFAKIKDRHNKIIAISEIFSNIHNQLIQLEESAKAKSLNNFIFVLTTLTFISVLADVIGTVDYVNKLIPSPLLRLFFLITPTIIVFIIWGIYLRKYK